MPMPVTITSFQKNLANNHTAILKKKERPIIEQESKNLGQWRGREGEVNLWFLDIYQLEVFMQTWGTFHPFLTKSFPFPPYVHTLGHFAINDPVKYVTNLLIVRTSA